MELPQSFALMELLMLLRPRRAQLDWQAASRMNGVAKKLCFDGLHLWGTDRIDHVDSKSSQPGETPGFLAIFYLNLSEGFA